MEDAVLTFVFKAAVMFVTSIYINQASTEFKNFILFYPSITQAMVESHCEILWANNSGVGLGRHPTEDYGAATDNAENLSIISQQRLKSKMIILWINKSLTTDNKCKLRAFKISYTYNNQDDGAAVFHLNMVKLTCRLY